MAWEIGCTEACASDAAQPSTRCGSPSPRTSTDCSLAWPLVRVPVLSRNSCCTPASASRVAPSLIRMPRRAAREMPPMMAIGTARISGQGVATTSTASARSGSPLSHQASAASTRVSGMKNSA
ncbi:hypothetical protein D3C80_1417140 [compost metagenome]